MVADFVRLDVHDWVGHLLHRIKGKTTEKIVGVAILNLVRDLYGITDKEMIELTAKLNGEDEQQDPANRMRKDIRRKVVWKHKIK